MFVAEARRLVQQVGLDLGQQVANALCQPGTWHDLLNFPAGNIPTADHHRTVLQVARPDLDAHRHTLQLPFVELEARCEIVAVIQLDAQVVCGQFLLDSRGRIENSRALGVPLVDRHDDDLDRRQLGRNDKALVIAVRHDHSADETRAQSPRSGVTMLLLVVRVEELDVECPRKVLSHVVRGARLQRLAVAHHRLDRERHLRAGEAFLLRLLAADDRDGGVVDGKIGIDVEHAPRLLDRLVAGGVGGVPFLPVKLQRAQEELGAHLPADDAVPQVDQDRQVAITLDPARVGVADDRLRGRADGQRLGQRLAAAVRDDGQLRRKALDVAGFLFEKTHGDEHGKAGVLVAGLLEAPVQRLLNILPQRPAIGAYDHRPAHGAVVGHLGAQDERVIPVVEVFGARCQRLFICQFESFLSGRCRAARVHIWILRRPGPDSTSTAPSPGAPQPHARGCLPSPLRRAAGMSARRQTPDPARWGS